MRPGRPITALIATLAGMIAWGLHFGLIYAIATLACLRPQLTGPKFDFRTVSVAMTVILLAGTAMYIYKIWNDQDPKNAEPCRFLNVLMIVLGLLALTAIVWATLSVFIITDCRTQ